MRMWAILLDLVTKARFLVIFSLIFFSWASVQEWQMCRTRTSRRRSGGISPTSTQPFWTPAGATAWSCSPPASMDPGSFLVSSRFVNRVWISITFPGAIYYMILYIHGDLALTESKEEPPCIDNVSGLLELYSWSWPDWRMKWKYTSLIYRFCVLLLILSWDSTHYWVRNDDYCHGHIREIIKLNFGIWVLIVLIIIKVIKIIIIIIRYGTRQTTTQCPDAMIVMSLQSVLGCLIQVCHFRSAVHGHGHSIFWAWPPAKKIVIAKKTGSKNRGWTMYNVHLPRVTRLGSRWTLFTLP